MTQPTLNFQKESADNAEIIKALVYDWLSDGQWHTAKSFQVEGVEMRGIDRVLRTVAERSKGQVISGQKGYKLTRFATVEEIDHAESWLLSQARHMTARAVEIRRARNTRAA